eukprot:9498216-Pyramimonas_sp.AAC.1
MPSVAHCTCVLHDALCFTRVIRSWGPGKASPLIIRCSLSICLCDYEAKQELCKLPCMHEFHNQCITKWFKQHRVCPLCKLDVAKALSENAHAYPEDMLVQHLTDEEQGVSGEVFPPTPHDPAASDIAAAAGMIMIDLPQTPSSRSSESAPNTARRDSSLLSSTTNPGRLPSPSSSRRASSGRTGRGGTAAASAASAGGECHGLCCPPCEACSPHVLYNTHLAPRLPFT